MVEYSSLTPGMDEAPAKHMYHAPRLQDYGKVDVLTLASSIPSQLPTDGGRPPHSYNSTG
jgi:hypothetical protein